MKRVCLMAVLAGACSGVTNETPSELEPRGALRLVELEVPPSVGSSESLHWRFVAQDGQVVEGEVADPGLVRSELDDGQHVTRATTRLPWVTSLPLAVPDLDGELEVLRGAQLVTRRHVRRGDEAGRTRQAVASWGDVLGPPMRLIARTVPGPDVLLVSEGFTAAEMPAFRTIANELAARLVQAGQLPVPGSVGFLVQEVASRQSGADDPATNTYVDTAFDTTFGFGGTDRCLFFGTPEAFGMADGLRQAAGATNVMAIVNSTKHGGCASGTMSTYSLTPNSSGGFDAMARGMHHELGHSIFALADEYDSDQCTPFTARVNVSNSLNPPWADLISRGTPIPTTDSAFTVGVFEGAQYCTTGKYRPAFECRMRLNSSGFCPVCQRERERILRSWSGATIELEPNSVLSSGQLIQTFDSVRGAIGSSGDLIDFYRTTVPAGECLIVQLKPPAGTDLDLSVSDSVGRVLKTSAKVGVGLPELVVQCGLPNGLAGIAVKYRSGTVGSTAVYRLDTSI